MSDGTLNFPLRGSAPSSPSVGRVKVWVSSEDGKPRITNENGETETFESVYGSDLSFSVENVDETNNTDTFSEYLLMNYSISSIDPLAFYEVSLSLVWGYSSGSTDFRGRLLINGTQYGEEFRQEPKDSGNDQRFYTSLSFPVSGSEMALLSGNMSWEFAASAVGNTARMFYCYLKLKRLV